jgi:hypothetical protein
MRIAVAGWRRERRWDGYINNEAGGDTPMDLVRSACGFGKRWSHATWTEMSLPMGTDMEGEQGRFRKVKLATATEEIFWGRRVVPTQPGREGEAVSCSGRVETTVWKWNAAMLDGI